MTDVLTLIATLRKLDAEATPGPWPMEKEFPSPNRELTHTLRNELPRIIALLEAGERMAEAAADLHRVECPLYDDANDRHADGDGDGVCLAYDALAAWRDAGRE